MGCFSLDIWHHFDVCTTSRIMKCQSSFTVGQCECVTGLYEFDAPAKITTCAKVTAGKREPSSCVISCWEPLSLSLWKCSMQTAYDWTVWWCLQRCANTTELTQLTCPPHITCNTTKTCSFQQREICQSVSILLNNVSNMKNTFFVVTCSLRIFPRKSGNKISQLMKYIHTFKNDMFAYLFKY